MVLRQDLRTPFEEEVNSYSFERGLPSFLSNAKKVMQYPESDKGFLWEAAEYVERHQGILDNLQEQQEAIASKTTMNEQQYRNRQSQIFSEITGTIENLLANSALKYNRRFANMYNFIRRIRTRAEHIRRENPGLITEGPVDIVAPENLSRIFVISHRLEREERREYGLHFNLINSSDLAVGMAFMPPGHVQPFHKHNGSPEYTMNLDGNIAAFFKKGEENIVFNPKSYEIAFFNSETLHTLHNPNNFVSRNITVKSPISFENSSSANGNNMHDNGYGKLVKPYTEENHYWGNKKCFNSNNGYKYSIEIIALDPSKKINYNPKNHDDFIYVVDGNVRVEVNGKKSLKAPKNSLVVARQNSSFSIQGNNYKPSVLYRVVRR